VVGRQNADIADALHIGDVAIATIFWLSVYEVHIGATWRIRLNRPCVAAMWPYVICLERGANDLHTIDATATRSSLA